MKKKLFMWRKPLWIIENFEKRSMPTMDDEER